MVTVDLITGFLGSGKTTFIKEYAKYLMDKGQRICILENDYGAVNVDMMLLGDLRGENCELEMVSGGCDYDSHRRRFKTKLISMGMCGYDRVLIEPSGIFDVDEFFDVLYEEPLDSWYKIGSVITVVDAGLKSDLSEKSDALLASQLANAGKVVLSHVQEVSGKALEDTIEHINRACEMVKCKRHFELGKEIIGKNWVEFDDNDWNKIADAGYVQTRYVKMVSADDKAYSSLTYMNVNMDERTLLKKAETIFHDPDCGNVIRIKGFIRSEDDMWYELNATTENLNIKPIKEGQDVIIVIGEALVESSIARYFM